MLDAGADVISHAGNLDIAATIRALDRGQEARVHGRHAISGSRTMSLKVLGRQPGLHLETGTE